MKVHDFCSRTASDLADSRGGRHEPPDAESVSLSAGEAQSFIEQRVAQEVLARLPDNLRLHELAVHHLPRDAPPLVTGGDAGAANKNIITHSQRTSGISRRYTYIHTYMSNRCSYRC